MPPEEETKSLSSKAKFVSLLFPKHFVLINAGEGVLGYKSFNATQNRSCLEAASPTSKFYTCRALKWSHSSQIPVLCIAKRWPCQPQKGKKGEKRRRTKKGTQQWAGGHHPCPFFSIVWWCVWGVNTAQKCSPSPLSSEVWCSEI